MSLAECHCQTHDCGLTIAIDLLLEVGQSHPPRSAPRSISLNSARLALIAFPSDAAKLAVELFLCRHKYGVSPGDGVSRLYGKYYKLQHFVTSSTQLYICYNLISMDFL